MLVGEHGGDAMVPRIAMMKALRRHKPKAEADAAHVAVKTEMLQMRLMEKRRELVRRDDVDALIDHRWHRTDSPVRHVGPVLAGHDG